MATNARVRLNPAIQRMPKNEREWTQFANELSQWVLKVARLGDGSLLTAADVTINGLDEIPGVVMSERSLPMVNIGNVRSAQSVAPLSASDAGGTATIAVAAHTLATTSGDVTFNSGSITGLAFETQYFVYCDGGYTGGAVTYIATTDSADLVGALDRYYVGLITTGLEGLVGDVDFLTKGNPTVFATTANHGFSSGNSIVIDDIVDDGPGGDIESTFNGNTYVITVTSLTQFTVPVDSSSLTNVWASGGTATRAATTPVGPPVGGGGGGGTYIP